MIRIDMTVILDSRDCKKLCILQIKIQNAKYFIKIYKGN